MSCTFCGDVGHNITNCPNHGIEFSLMKLRCKTWKSLQKKDLSIVFSWLYSQDVSLLRVICIHKYHIFPKSRSKKCLVAIVMHLEFYRIMDYADESFWICDLPKGFSASSTFDCNNERERSLLIVNINIYKQPEDEEFLMCMPNDVLGDILMNLITEYRKQTPVADRHVKYRARIDYIELKEKAVEVVECSICYENIGNMVARLGCNHEFCCGCIEKHIRCTKLAIVYCPLCRGEITSVSAFLDGNQSFISIL